jgi:hypothetical protein
MECQRQAGGLAVKRRAAHESEFVDCATLFRTSAFSSGEITSAGESGELPFPIIRNDGVAIFRRSDIEKLWDL